MTLRRPPLSRRFFLLRTPDVPLTHSAKSHTLGFELFLYFLGDMVIPGLKLLEEKLDGMLERHARVCREKAILSQRLSEQQEANGRLREQLQQYEQEREEIRTKLERILGQFDGLGITLSDEGEGDESLG